MHFSTFLRNKYSILILGIAIIIYLVNISNKNSILTKNLAATSISKQKNNLSPVAPHAIKASNNIQEKQSIQNEVVVREDDEENVEYQLLWEEINVKWNEELKNFLISISQREGLRMFNAYTEAHKRFLKEQDRIDKKYQKLNAIKPLSEKQHNQFGAESSKNSKKANERNKKIFGQYYNLVKNFHKEFEESIQVYSRDNPIFFDLNFNQ